MRHARLPAEVKHFVESIIEYQTEFISLSLNWETFYNERNLFLLHSNYAIVQQAFVPGPSQIPEQSMRVSNFVPAHQQINDATNVPENENVSREEATEAFKTRAINLLKSPKPELHDAVRALKEMTIFLIKNSIPLSKLRRDICGCQ